MKDTFSIIVVFVIMLVAGVMIGYWVREWDEKNEIRISIKPKPKPKHKHNIHCCKSDTLRSTYHTYIRVNNSVDHLKTCRCYEK